jgi:stress response protein YsnF
MDSKNEKAEHVPDLKKEEVSIEHTFTENEDGSVDHTLKVWEEGETGPVKVKTVHQEPTG